MTAMAQRTQITEINTINYIIIKNIYKVNPY
jgi:hypothetical protein